MPMLKTLFCQHLGDGEIENLRKKLPGVQIDILEEERAKPKQIELCCFVYHEWDSNSLK